MLSSDWPITARILGMVLRFIFGKHLRSVTHDYIKTNRTFTFLGLAEDRAKSAETPGSVSIHGWRLNRKKATQEPWIPWVHRKMECFL